MATWIGNVLVLATVAIGIWYTLETRRTRLKARPKVVFRTRPHQPRFLEDSTGVDLFVENIGEAAAINILVERTQGGGLKLKFEPEHIPILQVGEQQQLAMFPVEGESKPDLTMFLDDPSISQNMT